MSPLAPSSPLSIGIAGYGKMGGAMTMAWVQSPFVRQISILDPFPLIDEIPNKEKVAGYTEPAAFLKDSSQWDILVLAVKPQSMDALCGSLKDLRKDLPILSIAAGKSLGYFAAKFGETQPVIRAMPNTPAAIGKGMSVAVASPAISAETKANVNFLVSCFGKMEWVKDENLMDAVTAVSGSGPAYVFYLIESLAQAGVASGLDKDFAVTLARQTVIGAAALAEDSLDMSAEKLRENVTSPNGTTAAALSSLMDGRFQDVLNEAVAKATARSKELSK